MVTDVTLSDVSWDSFLLSWQAKKGAFEGFLVEVMDAESGAEWQNHTVAADARSLPVKGLSPSTWYRANLYGVYRGSLLEPVYADTITGIGVMLTIVAAGPTLNFCLASATLRKMSNLTSHCIYV